jgi:O-antigen ligase
VLMIFSPIRSWWSSRGGEALVVWLTLAPLFLVTVRSWSSLVLILGAIACFVNLMRRDPRLGHAFTTKRYDKLLVILVLFAPVLSIAVSSLLRGSHVLANYDSPARFLVAVVIFLFAIRQRANMAQYLQYTAPLALVLTLLHQLFFFQPRLWTPDRMSTYFADPLVFGYTALTLGMMSLVSIHLLSKDSGLVLALKLAGAAIGLYLSVMSGSRTGWLAVPVVMAVWVYEQKLSSGKVFRALALGLVVALVIGFYAMSATVQQRLLLGVHEALEYPWVGIAPVTSVGDRITFLRVALDMFVSSPFAGHGDNGYDLTALPRHIYTYASPESLHLAFTAGFHNEMVSNAVRFGIGGLLAAAMLLFVPMALFVRQSRSANAGQRANASLGLVLTICFFISSLSTEVFDLKYMASFYAVMVAMLCASAIVEPRSQGDPAAFETGGI